MHIPDTMVQGPVCPVTAAMSVAGMAAAVTLAVKSDKKPTAARFAAVTALIFAGQMMNFAISSGTSGHLLGGVLAAALLGTPFGVLAIALVVAVQCLVFSDGGVTVLGANLFNMAILGAGVGGVLLTRLRAKFSSRSGQFASVAAASWISVMVAALAVSVQLALSGQIAFGKVLPAMLGTHAWIGMGEAMITVACFALFAQRANAPATRWNIFAPTLTAGVVALLLSPFASGSPDGLEWVAEKYEFLHESAPAFAGPLPDYAVPAISSEFLSTGLSGLIGAAICFALAWGVAGLLRAKPSESSAA